ncbi:MAG: 2,3-cyclic 3-phosphodiesterase [Patescibacteria group bacterium]|nr:2,3-cyclic 3-phosphodiesterase [Patescibacteria group bacterium]
MKRKIFISINIPERDRKRLTKATEKWQNLPVKWIKETNLHVTLAFLGFVDENILAEICERVGEVSKNRDNFDIAFEEIGLFPAENEPRMIALVGEPNEDLKNLVNDLEKILGLSGAPKKIFRPHITLGRIRKLKWETLAKKPEISGKYPLNISVESVDIMASDFADGESEYVVIESCSLK